MSSVPINTLGWRGTKWSKVPCLRKRDGRGLNLGPSDLEFEVLTTRPHTPPQAAKRSLWLSIHNCWYREKVYENYGWSCQIWSNINITVPCLRKRDGRGLNLGPSDLEFEVLTTRPHTPPQAAKRSLWLSIHNCWYREKVYENYGWSCQIWSNINITNNRVNYEILAQ